MSLSEQDKREMLEDAQSTERREDFRRARLLMKSRTFEEYLAWLTQMSTLPFPPRRSRLVEYKKILI